MAAQRIPSLLIRSHVFHHNVEPSAYLLHKVCSDDVRIAFQIHPDLCLSPESRLRFRRRKKLLLKRLQSQRHLVLVVIDHVHDSHSAFAFTAQNFMDLKPPGDQIADVDFSPSRRRSWGRLCRRGAAFRLFLFFF